MPRHKTDNFEENALRHIIIRLMEQNGQDRSVCGMCDKIGPTVIHHTKYDGATIYDLIFVCQKCNTQPENKHLT